MVISECTVGKIKEVDGMFLGRPLRVRAVKDKSEFLKLVNVEFFGNDFGVFNDYHFSQCEESCLSLCKYYMDSETLECHPKMSLLNEYRRNQQNLVHQNNRDYPLVPTGFRRFNFVKVAAISNFMIKLTKQKLNF
ncbi:hypothetical protein FEM48_Zijuj05G0033100 [Ziziphus jujuba var. spinosa]|uniref:Uncharacterized protein n=1 Tax=Ziziphus jujuba var. spinosa TaxID=714518 RepID=A0A978VCI5_ZIZJJ|nr:hypothetical protein FEM48_Zijuj05G0033100 [Ziziphus jujuba var. spinosa]